MMRELSNTTDSAKQNQGASKDTIADHPVLRFVATLVAIIVGLTTIYTFVNGNFLRSKYYDRFENNMYEGSFNPTLWERRGLSGVSIEQRNGALVLQPVEVFEGDNIALYPRKFQATPFKNFKAMEAKLKLSGKVSGTGFVKIQAFTSHNGLPWWLECNLEVITPGKLEYWCNVEEGAYNGSTPVPAYNTKNIETSFDQWHLARFELNDDHKGVQFYLDDRLIGQYTFPLDNTLNFSVLETQIGSWVHPTNNFGGYFDDIVIETTP